MHGPTFFLPSTDVFLLHVQLIAQPYLLLSHGPLFFYTHLSFPTVDTAWSVRQVSTYLSSRHLLYCL